MNAANRKLWKAVANFYFFLFVGLMGLPVVLAETAKSIGIYAKSSQFPWVSITIYILLFGGYLLIQKKKGCTNI